MKTYFEPSIGDPEYYSCLSHRTLSNFSYRVDDGSYYADPCQFEVMCQRKHSESRKSSNTVYKKDCSNVMTPRSAKSSPVSYSSSMPIDVPRSPAFAGSKFGSSPTPKSLPPPPSHWISPKCHPSQPCHEMARHIKMLLQMV